MATQIVPVHEIAQNAYRLVHMELYYTVSLKYGFRVASRAKGRALLSEEIVLTKF